MSRNKYTAEQKALLALPVILTPAAWDQAVHVDNPKSFSELAQRLAYTVKAAYHGLLTESQDRPAMFGFYRHLPSGEDRSHRHYLALNIQVVRKPTEPAYLLISLPIPLWRGH
ncbi:hypothetical protein, partial [Pseudomonas savastanoi]|uniref:hypothetical protein n=1 Tax=Pseudomonas savastanoi TaxID=29438 RepID=UPI000F009EB7